MSEESFFNQPPAPPRHQGNQRVIDWNNSALNTFENADYRPKARQAQNAVASSSKTGCATPHTPPNVSKTPETTPSSKFDTKPTRGPLDARSQAFHGGGKSYAASARSAMGPTDFTKDARASVKGQPASYAAVPPPAALQGKENGLPPHLRSRSTTPKTTEATAAPSSSNQTPRPSTPGIAASASKLSKHGTRAPPMPMNSGTAAKSAKMMSKFPCTYPDCDKGFAKEKAMKSHKQEEHDYCRFCDEDCLDPDDLLSHKLESEDHICCMFCGEDFRSEEGRNRHQLQSHANHTECKCVGCHQIFAKGSALIDHIYQNKCRSNKIPQIINEDTLRKQRVQAALHMDLISHIDRSKHTSKMIADMQPPEDNESVAGGVQLEPQHLLDEQTPLGGTVAKRAGNNDDDDDDDLIDLADPSYSKTKETDFPTLTAAASIKDKDRAKPTPPLDSSMSGLNLNSLPSGLISEYAKKLFPGLERTAEGEGTGTTMVDWRRACVPGQAGEQHIIKTDWDFEIFRRANIDGLFHCPFSMCGLTTDSISTLKTHLTSGYHQGTDHRCLKCLKPFKTPSALIAHMESNSIRCHMKDTEAFGAILSVVSGGFLGVKGRGADGEVVIAALDEGELEAQAEWQREEGEGWEGVGGGGEVGWR